MSIPSSGDQVNSGIRKFLARPEIYNFFEFLIGAGTKLRPLMVDEFLRLNAGDRVLDIGCGTAQLLPFLPNNVEYFGFDISADYINFARKKFGSRGSFKVERVSEASMSKSEKFDKVVAMGLLHHLDDREASQLFKTANEILDNEGILLTLDPVFHPNQSKWSRYFVSKDRGQHVRSADEYRRLAEPYFQIERAEVYDGLLRMPYSHFLMSCKKQ